MRRGVRDAVSRASRRGPGAFGGPALLAILCAGAFAPIVAAAAGTGAVAAAGLGVLGGVGSGVVGTVLSGVVDRLRNRHSVVSPQTAESELIDDFTRTLDADDDQARRLRTEIAAILGDLGIAEEALRAAVDAGSEPLQERLLAELAALAADVSGFGAVLIEIHRTLDTLQDRLYRQGAERRAETEAGRRQATQLRLIREQLTGIEHRLDATVDVAAEPHTVDLRWGREPPYRGLWPFQEDQAAIFHGRARLTAELTGHVEAAIDTTGVTIVTGASGVGKSSLIRAGLLPAITKGQLAIEGSQHWPRLVMTPGARPIEELGSRLSALSGTDPASIRNTIAARPDQAYLYARQAVFTQTDGLLSEQRDLVRETGRLMLFVDQFEELFTLVRDERERRAFIAALFSIATGGDVGSAPTDRASGVVVLGVRGDFIDRCAAVPALVPVLQRRQFVVGPPEPEELRQVITGPAASAGLRLDDGLADDILADLRAASQDGAYTAGALPLLSQTMLSIWQRREDDRLTRGAYSEVGGIRRSIEAGAEAIYGRLHPQQRVVAEQLFRRLTVIDRHGEVSRRRASRTALMMQLPGLRAVLEAFTAGRLVVVSGDAVEIAHDVLLRSWKRLDGWLQADRMHRALLTEVADDAAQWIDSGRDSSFLYQGVKFEAAERTRTVWVSNPDTYVELDDKVEAFLAASRRSARRRSALRRAVAVSLVMLLAVSITAAGVAFNLNRIAATANADLTAELDGRLARDLRTRSTETAATDRELSQLLAAAAWQVEPSTESHNALVRALNNPIDYTHNPHRERVSTVELVPSSGLVASRSHSDGVILWDVDSREVTARIEDAGGNRLTFSPDGRRFAYQTYDSIKMVDLETMEAVDVAERPSQLKGIDFSPGGEHLLVYTQNDIAMWTLDGEPVLEHSATGMSINGHGFDRDGESPIIAVGGESFGAFDIQTGGMDTIEQRFDRPVTDIHYSELHGGYLAQTDRELWILDGLDGEPRRLWRGSFDHTLSSDGRYLVEWTDRALTLHDLTGASEPRTSVLRAQVADAAVSDDGATIVLGGQTGLTFVDVASMTSVPSFQTDFPELNDAALSGDGELLAMTRYQETTRVWRLDPENRELGAIVFDDADWWGSRVAFHPAGDAIVVTQAGDHALVDLATAERLDAPWYGPDWIAGVTYSPAGTRVAVVGGENLSGGGTVSFDIDSFATLMDTDTGADAVTVEGVIGEDAIHRRSTVVFTADDRLAAAVGLDGRIRVWDARDGTLLHEPSANAHFDGNPHFSADGTRLVIAARNGPIVWDLVADELTAMEEHEYVPSMLGSLGLGAFPRLSEDGRYVYWFADDNLTIKIWSADTGEYLTSVVMASGRITDYLFPSPDEVLAIDADGTGYWFDLDFIDDPYERLCAEAGRTLTSAEWAEHLPTADPESVRVC